MNFIKPNLKSLPEQVDINTNDIKNLKSIIKSSYKTEKELETTTITIPITDTNAPQDTTSGWLFDSVGHLFSINGGDDTNLLLEYYTNFRGPAGINGVPIVQTTGTSTESVMSQNAVTNELESKANIDSSNLSSENVTSWSNKLGIGTITNELSGKANLDASNLSSENVTSWANKFFPIGSIYMSVDSTSPASFLGGTWEQIKDCFLWASGDTTSITYTENGVSVTKSLTAGSTGGETTHTLTQGEMPSHNHQLLRNVDTGEAYATGHGGGSSHTGILAETATTTYIPKIWDSYVGENQAHNNMPPYLAVYMWERIA